MIHTAKKAIPGGLLLLFLTGGLSLLAQSHHWNSHAEVARKVMSTFEELETYTARFQIVTKEGRSTKKMSGKVYFSRPGKIRFDFTSPARDFIVSDGRILWIYMSRLRAVGKQDLRLDTKDENGRRIFLKNPGTGLKRLFRKYHYRFDTVEQPREVEGRSYFVMDLEQREKIGGYEKIKLFVDSDSYLVRRAVATDSFGRETTITFTDLKVNQPIEGKLFQYKPDDSVRVVSNPLVGE